MTEPTVEPPAEPAVPVVQAETVQEHQLPARRTEKPPVMAGAPLSAIIPRDLDEAWRLTDAIVKAGMVPKSYEGKDVNATRAALMIGVMKGMEIGLPPITALSSIMIINNRPCVWGDGAVALVQAKGEVERVEQTFAGTEGEDDWTATYRIWRRGQSAPYVGTFSVKDAKRARLWANTQKPIWTQYPQRMLMARARAYALRDGFADCLSGLSIAEEVQDIPAAPEKVETSFLDDNPAQIEGPTGVQLDTKASKGGDAPAPTVVPSGLSSGLPGDDTTPPQVEGAPGPLADWPAFLEDINAELADAKDMLERDEILHRYERTLAKMEAEAPELHAKVGK